MRRLALICAGLLLPAAAQSNAAWVAVPGAHFAVTSNGGVAAARHVAGQMERVRGVFAQLFPTLPLDTGPAIDVLAVKNASDFRALEPPAYVGRGKLDLAGFYQPGTNRDLILLRLDVPDGGHPYGIVYHELFHRLTRSGANWLPLWLAEGLAQFYETMEIGPDRVAVGRADPARIAALRSAPLLPLNRLFATTRSSPDYRQEDAGTMFYAESWALTHHMLVHDRDLDPDRLPQYLRLVQNGADPVTAARQAFGDLDALQRELQRYISQPEWEYFEMPLAVRVDDASLAAVPLDAAAVTAVRTEFLQRLGRAPLSGAAAAVLPEEASGGEVADLSAAGILATGDGAVSLTDRLDRHAAPPPPPQPPPLNPDGMLPAAARVYSTDRIGQRAPAPPPKDSVPLADAPPPAAAVQFATGIIVHATCSAPARIDLTLDLGAGRTLALHADNLGQVELDAATDSPAVAALASLNRCGQLAGLRVKAGYQPQGLTLLQVLP